MKKMQFYFFDFQHYKKFIEIFLEKCFDSEKNCFYICCVLKAIEFRNSIYLSLYDFK
jgi:hypothetical protein